MSGMESMTQTPGGKAAITVVLVAAVAALGYQFVHMSDGEKSRDVSATQAISDAQRQIDAINQMNIPEDQKKALIAHFQGNIDTASGKGAAKPPGVP